MSPSTQIPNKLYFRIGEVADLLTVKPYVLRYWETEFLDVRPAKSKSGQRLYKRRDVELLLRIKDLLYLERFTINGARKRLKEWMREERGIQPNTQIPLLASVPAVCAPSPASSVARPIKEEKFSKVFTKIKKDLESVMHLLKI